MVHTCHWPEPRAAGLGFPPQGPISPSLETLGRARLAQGYKLNYFLSGTINYEAQDGFLVEKRADWEKMRELCSVSYTLSLLTFSDALKKGIILTAAYQPPSRCLAVSMQHFI